MPLAASLRLAAGRLGALRCQAMPATAGSSANIAAAAASATAARASTSAAQQQPPSTSWEEPPRTRDRLARSDTTLRLAGAPPLVHHELYSAPQLGPGHRFPMQVFETIFQRLLREGTVDPRQVAL